MVATQRAADAFLRPRSKRRSRIALAILGDSFRRVDAKGRIVSMPPPIPVGFLDLRQRQKRPQVLLAALIVFIGMGLAVHLLG